jgi:hypothetical protein
MTTVYGIEIAPKNDRYVAIAEKSMKMLLESLLPGAALCNTFPVRKYERNLPSSFSIKHLVSRIPAWFPGAGFKRHALYCRKLTNEMLNRPFEFVKTNIVWSFWSSLRHHLTVSLGKRGRNAMHHV